MDRPWHARLACGHTLLLAACPSAGTYLTCPDKRCQTQREVTGAWLEGPAHVQGTLFELATREAA